MKAVGYRKSLPIDAADALFDFETGKPEPRGRDIRVAVKAISANPVDYKVRKRAEPKDGDVWVAELVRSSNTVRWYVNGTLVCRATDALISNLGNGAGIAAFRRGPQFGSSDSAALGFRSFRAEPF